MKSLPFFLLFSISCLADSIQLPTGGFLWASPTSSSQLAYTVGNVEGEYSANMPVIYALQFGADLASFGLNSQFYLKLGNVAYAGTFANWSFENGLFVGSFSGSQIDFYANSWSCYSLTPISGVLTQTLNLLPGCVGYSCGSMLEGSLTFAQPMNLEAVPEPESWVLMVSGAFVLAGYYWKEA